MSKKKRAFVVSVNITSFCIFMSQKKAQKIKESKIKKKNQKKIKKPKSIKKSKNQKMKFEKLAHFPLKIMSVTCKLMTYSDSNLIKNSSYKGKMIGTRWEDSLRLTRRGFFGNNNEREIGIWRWCRNIKIQSVVAWYRQLGRTYYKFSSPGRKKLPTQLGA